MMRINRNPTAADLLALAQVRKLKVQFRTEPGHDGFAVFVKNGRTADDMATWEMVFPNDIALGDAVDELGEEVDAELASDILTIEFKGGSRFVLNSHRAARQIWMAADAHAWHFDATPDGGWVAHKDGSELWATLSATLSLKLGRAITLKPV